MLRIREEWEFWRLRKLAQSLLMEAKQGPKAWERTWRHRRELAMALTEFDVHMEYVRRGEGAKHPLKAYVEADPGVTVRRPMTPEEAREALKGATMDAKRVKRPLVITGPGLEVRYGALPG